MPNSRQAAASAATARLSSSETIDTMVARTAPAILALLGDGMPRSKGAIVAALADQHPKEAVARTLIRLTITDRLVEEGRRYRLPPGAAASVG